MNRANPRYFLAYLLYRFWLYQRSLRNPAAPFFFGFATLVLTIYVAIVTTDLLVETLTDFGFFTLLNTLHFGRSKIGVIGLSIVGAIWAILHCILVYKDRYVAWFEVFAAETSQQRSRGTAYVFCYLLFIALLIVTSITVYDVRHGQSMFL